MKQPVGIRVCTGRDPRTHGPVFAIRHFESTDLHCPKCGSVGVWMESVPGDVDLGPDYYCTRCGAVFVYSFRRQTSNRIDANMQGLRAHVA